MDIQKIASQVAIVAVGVVAAGVFMKALRGQFGWVWYASDGFDT